MRLLLSYLVLLGIIFIKGDDHLSLQFDSPYQSHVHGSHGNNFTQAINNQNETEFLNYSLFIDDDNEEDEYTSTAKKLLPSLLLSMINGVVSQVSFSNSLKLNPPFVKHFSYLSSDKYIFQRVLKVWFYAILYKVLRDLLNVLTCLNRSFCYATIMINIPG